MPNSAKRHERRPQRSRAVSTKPQAKRMTKSGVILRLLKRAKGARMAELQKATGWQPHSIRAALTGLRKKGVSVTRQPADNGASVYRVGIGQ